MQALAAEGAETAGDVIVAGVADEEYASIGVEALVRRWHADAGVIAEPTGGGLVVAHKGFAWIDVDVHGHAAHGSDFRQGVDAISHAGHLLAAYDNYHQQVLAAVADGIVTRPSVHASLISGGRELSTYPDHCRVSFERRTVPGEARADIDNELADLIDTVRRTVPGFAADATISFYREAYQIDIGEPIVQHLSAAVREVIGREPSMGGASGWMDSAVMGAAGIPTVIFGPWGEGAHAAVEWVSLASVIGAADVYARLVESFCGPAGAEGSRL
jgi:acetylornithine deacetylase